MKQLINSVRRWFWAFKLRLICAELVDVREDMTDALHAQDFSMYRGLVDFHSELIAERNSLQRLLANH